MCGSSHLGPLVILIIEFFLLNRSQVADRFEQPAMVEPLHPFQQRLLHSPEMAPRAASANDLGLVQPEDRFRERIVVAVADAPDRGLDAGLGQPLRIADRQVLHASVTVVNQRLTWSHSAVMQCLLTRIQREVGAQRVLHHRGLPRARWSWSNPAVRFLRCNRQRRSVRRRSRRLNRCW